MKHTQTLGVFSYETIGFYYERIATNAAGVAWAERGSVEVWLSMNRQIQPL